MDIVFFGSDDFAVTNLQNILKSHHRVVACVTQPDKAKGRNRQISATLVKDYALSKNIEILQPADLAEEKFVTKLKNYNADLFVVIAYGKILPEALLALPKVFCINLHASLLPKYRGAAPVNWAIINGEKETGITIFKLNASPDAGEIIIQRSIPILESDTSVTLRNKTASFGGELLMATLDSIERNDFTLTPQNNDQASLAPKLTKDQGLIFWSKPAREIHNMVRGLLPWPGAYCHYSGKRLKILKTQVVKLAPGELKSGQVADISKGGFIVMTGE